MQSFAAHASADQRRLVVIIADTLIKGVSVPAGEEPIEVDAADAATLITYSKAVPYVPPVELTPEALASAAALAKQDLLDKIAVAKSVEALEDLLSEDPDIVAAYEKRLMEVFSEP